MTLEIVLIIVGLVLVGAAVAWGMFFSRDSRIHRQLVAAPIEPVAAALTGAAVRLTGTVEPHEQTLLAPLSRRRCIHYRMILEERQMQRHQIDQWMEIHREERSVDFSLRDASGLALVRMQAARVAVVIDRNSRSGFLDNPTPEEAALLERLGEDPLGFAAMNRALRYTEGAIEVGEEVTVLGLADPGDERHRLVITAPADGEVLVTDEPTTVHTAPR